MAYSRASAIPGTNVTLFGLGEGEGEGPGSNWAGPRGAEVGMTGIGGVRVLRARPWTETGGARSGNGVPSTGPWVEERVLRCAGMGFEAEELMVLSGWVSRYTLLLVTQVLGK